MYAYGREGNKDVDEAIKWLRLADGKTHPDVSKLLELIPKARLNESPDDAHPQVQAKAARTIDLLRLADPQVNAVNGIWKLEDGALVSDNNDLARLEFLYEPPAEYDFKIIFSRKSGNQHILQVLTDDGHDFAWSMDTLGKALFGFESINGEFADQNLSAVTLRVKLHAGTKYTSVVQVRKDCVRAYLDGKLIAQWRTDGKDLSLADHWKLRSPRLLGVGSCKSPTLFHSAEVIEVTGEGKKLAPVKPPRAPDTEF